jgi:hypothetical protein
MTPPDTEPDPAQPPSLHDLRGHLNGVVLQLEMAERALTRGDPTRAERAVRQARAAAELAIESLSNVSRLTQTEDHS